MLVTGFAASAGLLTGLQLEGPGRGEGGGPTLRLATQVAWVLAALALTAGGALAWSRTRRAGRGASLAVAGASTTLWTVVALLAGWDPVR
ncbi:hypothetical protein WDZ17_09905 [Pseudokineococcus basanitobsidens]|uniref:Uncharacterized protein n=1 Tax=Pseudokineococcus basanitobsidens TaxID=1926649 RepID=A0ABU8RKV0_9ACTN